MIPLVTEACVTNSQRLASGYASHEMCDYSLLGLPSVLAH